MDQTRKKAQALIDGIRNAINEGVKHYDKHNNPLTTVESVLKALKRDGEVKIVPPSFSNVVHIPRNVKLVRTS